MRDLIVDPLFWGAIAAALFAGFVAGLIILAALRGNERPEVVGAIRRRCEICEDTWAEPSCEDDLDLCPNCRDALDRARVAASGYDQPKGGA